MTSEQLQATISAIPVEGFGRMYTETMVLQLVEILESEFKERLDSGRDYLMQVQQSKITVEDTLEAFGWTRNGFNRE
jgi:hypothetical protein